MYSCSTSREPGVLITDAKLDALPVRRADGATVALRRTSGACRSARGLARLERPEAASCRLVARAGEGTVREACA